MAAEASSLNAGQPKPKDSEIAENGICHAQMRELLEDEEAQKKLVRKYIDKQALSYGAVFDLFETTKTTQSQYLWFASIFYFAYVVAEWPASYLAQHFPTGTVVSAFVVSWGTVLACTAASRNFAGLAICRFLLASFEAFIAPCFMMIVNMWYTRTEALVRAGSFYCFNGLGSMVGGILFYGVGQADEWDIKEAFKDLQVWLLFFHTLLNEVVNGGIANFGKLIVKGFTKDALLATAYGILYGAWFAFFIFTGLFCTSKFKNFRTIVMMTWVLPTLIAVTLFLKLDRGNKNGLLMSPSFIVALVVALQMPAANVAGYTKRVTSTAFVFLT
ncbi:MFS general substrate transporter [Colletotrichum eremochloae]|nr:MFS general substrate transporter [Colletotrichum eremochloae]